MADMATLKLALRLSRRYLADYQEYQEERAEYRRSGYRAHYCEHGTNMWTDYDAICGGCEDGMTMGDPIQRRERALAEAKERRAEANSLLDLISEAYRLHVETALDLPKMWQRVNTLLHA